MDGGTLQPDDARRMQGGAKMALGLDRASGGITGFRPSTPDRPLPLRQHVPVQFVVQVSGSGTAGEFADGVVLVAVRVDANKVVLETVTAPDTGDCLIQHVDDTVALADAQVFTCGPPVWYHDDLPVFLVGAAGGGGLKTQNLDGTDSGTTTDLRFDQATGSHKRARAGGETWDTHELLAAGPAQMGAVTTGLQSFEGDKTFLGRITRSETAGGGVPEVTVDSSGAGGVGVAGVTCRSSGADFSQVSAVSVAGGSGGFSHVLDQSNAGGVAIQSWCVHKDGETYGYAYTLWTDGQPKDGKLSGLMAGSDKDSDTNGIAFCDAVGFPTPLGPSTGFDIRWNIYAKRSEWDLSGYVPQGPIRHNQNFLADDFITHGGRRSGTDWFGLDDTFAVTIGGSSYNLKYVAGHLVQRSLASSPPPPPPDPPPVPPSPPSPPPPPPGTGMILGSAYFSGTGLPVTGRPVTLSGATSGTTATNGSGGYSFPAVNAGSNTVTLTPVLGETCTSSADGGPGVGGFAGTVAVGAGEVHSVGYIVTPFGPPPPAPPSPPFPPSPPPSPPPFIPPSPPESPPAPPP